MSTDLGDELVKIIFCFGSFILGAVALVGRIFLGSSELLDAFFRVPDPPFQLDEYSLNEQERAPAMYYLAELLEDSAHVVINDGRLSVRIQDGLALRLHMLE